MNKKKRETYKEIVAKQTPAEPEKTSLDELSLRLKPDSASIDLDPFLDIKEMADIKQMKPSKTPLEK